MHRNSETQNNQANGVQRRNGEGTQLPSDRRAPPTSDPNEADHFRYRLIAPASQGSLLGRAVPEVVYLDCPAFDPKRENEALRCYPSQSSGKNSEVIERWE